MKKVITILFALLLVVPAFALAQDFVVTGGTGYEWNADNSVLTITKNGLTVQNRENVAATSDRIVIDSGVSSVTLNGVSVRTEDGAAMSVEGETTVNLTGINTLITTADGCAGLQQENSDALLTISGTGSLTAMGGYGAAGIGSSSYMDANLLINGGTITLAEGISGAGIGSGDMGTAKVTITGNAKIVKAASVAVDVYGAGAGIGGGNDGDGIIEISGNAHIVQALGGGYQRNHNSGYSGAGIGGGWNAEIVIKDNALIEEAVGGPLGAGIGSGIGDEVTISISGNAEIRKAAGGIFAAGIGSGYQANADITISGGTIKLAQGGLGAAGIGSGNYSSAELEETSGEGSDITITAGTIEKAQGGLGGAGIGSGRADKARVKISGGTVNAYGGDDYYYHYVSDTTSLDPITGGAGAGIGSGGNGSDTTVVVISGGTVKAVGGGTKNGGAGIGGGNAFAKVDVSGKDTWITLAQGGAGAAGIGGGYKYGAEVSIDSAMIELAKGGTGAPGVGGGLGGAANAKVMIAQNVAQVGADASSWINVDGGPFTDKTDITEITALWKCFRTAWEEEEDPAPIVPDIPQTGDRSMISAWAALMMLSAAAITLLKKRKA